MRNPSAEISGSYRHETDIRDFGNDRAFSTAVDFHNRNTVIQGKHSFFTGPWLNEALLALYEVQSRVQPQHPWYGTPRLTSFRAHAASGSEADSPPRNSSRKDRRSATI